MPTPHNSLNQFVSRTLSRNSYCRRSLLHGFTITSAMTNACITPVHCMHYKAAFPLARRRKYQSDVTAQLSPSGAPQRSEEWFALRRDKLTTSTFSKALGFWKGSRYELWHDKVFPLDAKPPGVAVMRAMEWGVVNEAAALEQYKSISGRDVSLLGFATHTEERFNWIGASPDGLLEFFSGGGILEVKCPYNKGKPELGLPWSSMPFYYMPQVQGQMEVMDRDWAELYSWTPNGSSIFRVYRDRVYWELIHGILREFWWENVIPAREALLLGNEEEAKSYKPSSVHKLTEKVIGESRSLADTAKLLCREIAGHVEYYG